MLVNVVCGVLVTQVFSHDYVVTVLLRPLGCRVPSDTRRAMSPGET